MALNYVPPKRILVMGHSFVKRLARYLGDEMVQAPSYDEPWTNLWLHQGSVEVFFLGVGGLDLPSARAHLTLVADYKPDAVVLQLGENDLDGGWTSPEELALDLFFFGKRIIRHTSAKKVIICQLLSRPAASHPTYAPMLWTTNDHLNVFASHSPSVHYWQHSGLWGNHDTFGLDGVHLSNNGNYAYSKSIRGAVLRAIRLLP